MELKDEELQEFRAIWKRMFHEDISTDYARERATQLIELYAQLAKPLPSELANNIDPCAISSTAVNPQKPNTDRSSPSSPNATR